MKVRSQVEVFTVVPSGKYHCTFMLDEKSILDLNWATRVCAYVCVEKCLLQQGFLSYIIYYIAIGH